MFTPRQRFLEGRHTLLATEANVSGALLAEDLLAQHVCTRAVLRKLTQDGRVHPAQRERAAPIAADDVVQPSDDVARRDASQSPRCARRTEATVLSSTRTKTRYGQAHPGLLGRCPGGIDTRCALVRYETSRMPVTCANDVCAVE